MKVVIAGGTGFLGRSLVDSLSADGHDVVVLTRRVVRRSASTAAGRSVRFASWAPNGETGACASEVDGAAAVVNLAGESIAKRWTSAQKQQILDSRRDAT